MIHMVSSLFGFWCVIMCKRLLRVNCEKNARRECSIMASHGRSAIFLPLSSLPNGAREPNGARDLNGARD